MLPPLFIPQLLFAGFFVVPSLIPRKCTCWFLYNLGQLHFVLLDPHPINYSFSPPRALSSRIALGSFRIPLDVRHAFDCAN